jgi:hypothetical protein
MNTADFVNLHLFRGAAQSNDALSFLLLAEQAKDFMRESIEKNDLDSLGSQHKVLMSALGCLATHEHLRETWGIRPVTFMLPLLPLLPKNSHEAFKHLGVSAEIDEYLLTERFDMARLSFTLDAEGYKTLMTRLQHMRHGELYGQVACHLLGRLEELETTASEYHRIAKFLVFSLGACPAEMKLSEYHKERLEGGIPALRFMATTLTLDYALGLKNAGLPKTLNRLMETASNISTTYGNGSHVRSDDYRDLSRFVAPHLSEASLANLMDGLRDQIASEIPEIVGDVLFDTNRLDTRRFIHIYNEKHLPRKPLFQIAKSYIDRHPDPAPPWEIRLSEYLNVAIENSSLKDNYDVAEMSRTTGIPEEWIRKTDWYLVNRLERDLGL